MTALDYDKFSQGKTLIRDSVGTIGVYIGDDGTNASVITITATIPYSIPVAGIRKSISNTTFTGEHFAIEMKVAANASDVSFWGKAQVASAGASGLEYQILSPEQYPLLARFVSQVDAWAFGVDAGDWSTIHQMPLRITADKGMELITAPGVAANTTFSWNFKLTLAEDVVLVDLG